MFLVYVCFIAENKIHFCEQRNATILMLISSGHVTLRALRLLKFPALR